MYLLIFEFLGTNELLIILVVALMLLGPRRLPQMSRKIGKSIAEFKKTSEEFKRTWEKEVEMDSLVQDDETPRSMLAPTNSILNTTIERGNVSSTLLESNTTDAGAAVQSENIPSPSVTPVDPAVMRPSPEVTNKEPAMTTPTRKRDWL